MKNEYIPYKAVISSIQKESFDTNTYKVVFDDEKIGNSFDYKQGQFAEISLLGIGEAPISITSTPSRKGFLEFSIRAAGNLTDKIHELKVGDSLFVRGPYGNSFPYDEIKGKNLYFIAGGIGLPPLRSLINMVMDNRKDFGHVKILYGAKTPDEVCFKGELAEWKKVPDSEVWITVDKPCDGWGCSVGVVTELWKETEVHSENAVAFVCGPPIMIKFVLMELEKSGFKDRDIVMTLERYMKCGVGKCGHCNIGEKFVCIDGPVFTRHEVKAMPRQENVF
ncbi:MAG: FAD/NAD(P)-binding protein [Candidatus Omnitrophica bacterium]|nr:FAD/NAD(P)-binding protein [Candidatus Omnitrophota bacterium]MBU1127821.1 FAD/NAD(P)-binding protein [Candidatus Omnitrophota bacterium]MBU1784557.1 FAD/NAD(P)-binding protein [Candidatus Omnitrophota bacterium]MBU1851139.1 FAD/NAD(P)-binding protein [Candidatus Omnitrophota bacterium]